MSRKTYYAFTLAVLAGALTLAACSTTHEPAGSAEAYTAVDPVAPETADERNAAFQAASQSLPYELPEGYSFPSTAPALDFPGTPPVDDSSGAQEALRWFVCTKILAAWDEASVGNTEAADLHLLDITEAAQEDRRLRSMQPDIAAWSEPEVATSGDISLCSQWFDLTTG